MDEVDRHEGACKVKVGILPTLRAVFEVEEGLRMLASLTHELRADPRIELVTLENEYQDDVVRPENAPSAAWQRFIEEEIDVLLVIPVNYGDEVNTAEVARHVHGALKCPVYTFAPFDGDPRDDGTRPTDRTCGIYPMRQHLRHAGVFAGYIPTSNVGDPVFKAGLDTMLRVASVVREVRSMKILQIGGDTPTFPGIAASNLALYNYWGVEVINTELLTLVDRVRQRLADPPEWLDGDTARLFTGIDTTSMCDEFVDVPKTQALLLHGMLEMIQEVGANALTVRCWPELLQALKTMACFPLGTINDLGIPCSCETDRFGLVGLGMLGAASLGQTTPVFADNTIVRQNGDYLGWHCGPFAKSTCRNGCQPCLGVGWILPDPGAGYLDSACMELGDTITLARVSTNSRGGLTMITHEAEVVEGPRTRGTYFYYRVEDPAAYERELMDNPVVHHWGFISGAYVHVIAEASRWLSMPVTVLNNGDKIVDSRIECRQARG
jgi:L-fucose isomerase-like protein